MAAIYDERPGRAERVKEKEMPQFKIQIRSFMFGFGKRKGFLPQITIYLLLVVFGFVYLFPLLYMISTSFMSFGDLLDNSIRWVPRVFSLDNYVRAFESLRFTEVIFDTFIIAFLASLFQMAIASITGYAFQRFNFAFKKVFFGILIATFIIPPQVLMPATYQILLEFGLIGSMWSLFLPALTGQGFRSAILIMVFYQFYKQIPMSLDEAAQLDGAGPISIFAKIAIPSAGPAYIVSFVLSFVWYWNETFVTPIFLGTAHAAGGRAVSTLLLQLRRFDNTFGEIFNEHLSVLTGASTNLNEAVQMAATVITILPLLILYLVIQKQFVKGVDRSGITGE